MRFDMGLGPYGSGNIKTLDDALKAADVDLTAWDVDRYVVNSWGGEQVSYQVKAWLAAIPDTLYTLFGVGYVGYSAARTVDKGRGK